MAKLTKKQLESILNDIYEDLEGEYSYDGCHYSIFDEQIRDLVWEHARPGIERALQKIQIDFDKKNKEEINALKSKVKELENRLKAYESIEEVFTIAKKAT